MPASRSVVSVLLRELVEGLWSNLKTVELANLTAATLEEVIGQAWHGIEGVRGTPHLA